MKIMTILGTRPEIIRLSRIMPQLDTLAEPHVIVHTGQNYDQNLNDIFWQQLRLRLPDYQLECKASGWGAQVSRILASVEEVLQKEKPDRVLILGDTNSGLAALICDRMGIPVVHMEAGNRCFDNKVPEEKNRRLIDSVSTLNLPYTESSKQNLLQEGYHINKIRVTGNPIWEVLNYYNNEITNASYDVLLAENIATEHGQKYGIATFHRAETVDDPKRLGEVLKGLNHLATENFPIICSIHPRTRDKISRLGEFYINPHVRLNHPYGLFEFVGLELNASLILTDSGTVCEEACIYNVPCVIMRDATERPETLKHGTAILSGVNSKRIVECANIIQRTSLERLPGEPREYFVPDVSTRVIKHLIGEF